MNHTPNALDTELRRLWQKAQVSGYQLGTKDADNKLYESLQAIQALINDTVIAELMKLEFAREASKGPDSFISEYITEFALRTHGAKT